MGKKITRIGIYGLLGASDTSLRPPYKEAYWPAQWYKTHEPLQCTILSYVDAENVRVRLDDGSVWVYPERCLSKSQGALPFGVKEQVLGHAGLASRARNNAFLYNIRAYTRDRNNAADIVQFLLGIIVAQADQNGELMRELIRHKKGL